MYVIIKLDTVYIVKNKRCCFEVNTMLFDINAFFFCVPFKLHFNAPPAFYIY